VYFLKLLRFFLKVLVLGFIPHYIIYLAAWTGVVDKRDSLHRHSTLVWMTISWIIASVLFFFYYILMCFRKCCCCASKAAPQRVEYVMAYSAKQS
jgi:hypothetical protein